MVTVLSLVGEKDAKEKGNGQERDGGLVKLVKASSSVPSSMVSSH